MAGIVSGSSDQRTDCQAHPMNVPETIHSASLNCPVDLCIVFETETLHHLFNFTTYSTCAIVLSILVLSSKPQSEGLTCFTEENNDMD